jgi:hypothetical protein
VRYSKIIANQQPRHVHSFIAFSSADKQGEEVKDMELATRTYHYKAKETLPKAIQFLVDSFW